MQLPVLRALQSLLPQASITLLGAEPALELFQDDSDWHAIQTIQAWGLQHWGDAGDDGTRSAMEQWLDRQEFDLILDVSHAVWAVKEILWRRYRRILDTGGYLPSFHVSGVEAIKKSVGEHWGLMVPREVIPAIGLARMRIQFAGAYLRRRGWDGRPAIGVSALASSRLKRWPPERLAEVADALCSRFDLPVVVFAGPQPEIAERLASAMRHQQPPITAGALHLLDTAALLARCAVLICNDTGLMHMAAAVGTPVAAVFGPTAASIYLPPSPKSMGVISPVACPYRRTETFGPSQCLVADSCFLDRHSCIRAIPARDVLQAATALLEEKNP